MKWASGRGSEMALFLLICHLHPWLCSFFLTRSGRTSYGDIQTTVRETRNTEIQSVLLWHCLRKRLQDFKGSSWHHSRAQYNESRSVWGIRS
jgi:hypothetical protein